MNIVKNKYAPLILILLVTLAILILVISILSSPSPSPFLIATFIIIWTALFGAIFSLIFENKKDKTLQEKQGL